MMLLTSSVLPSVDLCLLVIADVDLLFLSSCHLCVYISGKMGGLFFISIITL